MSVFSNNNTKMKHSQRSNEKFVAFGIPAGITCPMAGACKDGCYAQAGRMALDDSQRNQQFRFQLSQKIYFLEYLEDALTEVMPKKKNKHLFVRLHDSGDFYSPEYLRAWITFARAHPEVTFYAYTKSVSMVKAEQLPDNLIVSFSYGGKEDALIDPEHDRHVIVVESEADIPKGYADASKDDHVMIENQKVALVFHNSKKKFKQTNFTKVILPEVI